MIDIINLVIMILAFIGLIIGTLNYIIKTNRLKYFIKPKTIDQLYEEIEQAYFNGELTEHEFDFYVNQLYNEEIKEIEEKNNG